MVTEPYEPEDRLREVFSAICEVFPGAGVTLILSVPDQKGGYIDTSASVTSNVSEEALVEVMRVYIQGYEARKH